jgi:hypothetical protein
MCLLGVFSILLFNISGVTVTKHISALVRSQRKFLIKNNLIYLFKNDRSLVDVTRTSVVWLVSLVITVAGWRNLGESTKPLSICMELLGFALMVIGNLTYQSIFVWPCLSNEKQE